jgi:UDP-glucose 4-epimerase
MTMPSALLTGATGFVGGHLLRRLVRDEWTVTALVRDSATDLGDGVRHVCADLAPLSPGDLGGEAFDVVFHLGAHTPKASGDSDPDAIIAANVVGVRRLLAATPDARRVVFAGTLDVYAQPPRGTRLTEQSRLDPRSLYAVSKLLGERLLGDCVAPGIETTVLRYGHLYGPGEEAYAKFIPKTIANLMRGRPPYVYGDGSAEVDVLYVDDAVEATVRAATIADAAGTINVVRGTSHALREIAERLVDIVGFLGQIRYVPDRPQGPSIRFDASLMRASLGSWPLVELDDGLRREVAHVAHASRSSAS